jgi:hypothetical protein
MFLGNESAVLISSPPFDGLGGGGEAIVAMIFAALTVLARTGRCCDMLRRAF